jgi:hypothetical protein
LEAVFHGADGKAAAQAAIDSIANSGAKILDGNKALEIAAQSETREPQTRVYSDLTTLKLGQDHPVIDDDLARLVGRSWLYDIDVIDTFDPLPSFVDARQVLRDETNLLTPELREGLSQYMEQLYHGFPLEAGSEHLYDVIRVGRSLLRAGKLNEVDALIKMGLAWQENPDRLAVYAQNMSLRLGVGEALATAVSSYEAEETPLSSYTLGVISFCNSKFGLALSTLNAYIERQASHYREFPDALQFAETLVRHIAGYLR